MELLMNVSDDCMKEYTAMKYHFEYDYILFKITEKNEIEVESSNNGTFEDFKKSLPLSECRFACVDIIEMVAPHTQTKKLAFCMWAPMEASLKEKVLYAATKEGFISRLSGLKRVVQLNSISDFDDPTLFASTNSYR